MATVTFGSFPRSGNFFLIDVLRKNLPSLSIDWVGHSAFALTKSPDSFTVVRNPVECVPSWIVYTKDVRENRAEKVLEWYLAYHRKCLENKIRVFHFNDLINDPISFVEKICDVKLDGQKFNYFRNETNDKSSFISILSEMQLAPNFQEAIELFDKLCDHDG